MIPRVALVTGAARGLGAEIARALAQEGHAVAVNDLPGSGSGAAVAERLRADGATAAFFGADVTDEEAVLGLHASIHDWQGPVDVLVCNATGPQPVIGVEDLTWPDLLDPLLFLRQEPDAAGAGRAAGDAGARVRADHQRRVRPPGAGRARLVGLLRGQGGAARPHPGVGPRARAARHHGQPRRTRLDPRRTPRRHTGTPAEVYDGYRRDVPLGELGTPADVAAVVTFLASDAARFVTAERVAVNGGHTIA